MFNQLFSPQILDHFFSQELEILLKISIAEIPATLQGKIRRKMTCYKHLLKESYFPLGQMTLPKHMRQAKIQITSSN